VQFEVLGLERYTSFSSRASSNTKLHFSVPLEAHAFSLESKIHGLTRATVFRRRSDSSLGQTRPLLGWPRPKKFRSEQSFGKRGPPHRGPGAALAALGLQISCSAQHPENGGGPTGHAASFRARLESRPFQQKIPVAALRSGRSGSVLECNGYANAARRPQDRADAPLRPHSATAQPPPRFFFQIAYKKFAAVGTTRYPSADNPWLRSRDCMALFSTTR